MCILSMGKSFKDSLKVLEADIQHANSLENFKFCVLGPFELVLSGYTVPGCIEGLKELSNTQNSTGTQDTRRLESLVAKASEFNRDYDGACLQMRMAYSPVAHFLLFLLQWTDCSLAGTLGLLRILIYKVYLDGTTTMSTHERKATVKEFYAVIFPSLMQLGKGISDMEDMKQKAMCMERYQRREQEEKRKQLLYEIEDDIEEECGICLETKSSVVLPNCTHSMCLNCYRDWRSRSQSCPFCRDNIKRVNSADLWILTDNGDTADMATITRENLRRLLMYIDKLPLVIPNSVLDAYDSHVK